MSPLAPEFNDLPDDPDDRPSDGFAGWFEALSGAHTEDELFVILARQRPPTSKLARQQLRGRLVTILSARFKELDSAASAARTADAWLLEGGGADDLQGQEFRMEEVQPWESAVVGADVLEELEALYDAIQSL
jgi:hypothetical protein